MASTRLDERETHPGTDSSRTSKADSIVSTRHTASHRDPPTPERPARCSGASTSDHTCLKSPTPKHRRNEAGRDFVVGDVTPNQLVIELAIEALDHREWPRGEAKTRVARASLFAAQALARDLIAAGREEEVAEIRDFISTIVPDPDADRVTQAAATTPSDP